MGLGNRLVLWRIDAARVKAEQEIAVCFGAATTLGDIARTTPSGDLLREGVAPTWPASSPPRDLGAALPKALPLGAGADGRRDGLPLTRRA